MDNTQHNNQDNITKGGVKTPEGKAVSKFNAVTHGILRQSVTEYEQEFYSSLLEDLITEYEPQGILEQILIERIALSYLKLSRAQKAETEFMKSKLDPRIDTTLENINFGDVIHEGYVPKINVDNVQKLMEIYGRYETTLENRLFRAVHELERAQRIRKGEKILAPITADINQVGSFGETDQNI